MWHQVMLYQCACVDLPVSVCVSPSVLCVWMQKLIENNPSTSRTSNVEVESFIKKWLRNAADHMGGHSKRMKKMLEKKRQRAMTAGAGACTTSHNDRQSSGDGTDSCLCDISSNDDVSDVKSVSR